MNLRFLTPVAPAGSERVARSPMEHAARAAGARFALRDGWNLPVAFPDGPEQGVLATAMGWADASHLGKFELEGPEEDLAAMVVDCSGAPVAPLGRATRTEQGWWCPVTPDRVLVLAEPGDAVELAEGLAEAAAATPGDVTVTDVTCVLAGLTLAGSSAGELIARFCALDLRPGVSPPGSFRPGSVARTPGYVLCEAPDRYLLLFGWALGHYLWTVVADAGEHLGGHAIGLDALPALDAVRREAPARA